MLLDYDYFNIQKYSIHKVETCACVDFFKNISSSLKETNKYIDVVGYFSEEDCCSSFSNYYYKRISDFKSNPSLKADLLVGDSLTEGQENYPNFFPDGMINRGISGDTTCGVLNRLESIVEENPRSVFLMIGTNNIGNGNDCMQKRLIPDILKIAATLNKKGIKVVVQSILPVIYDMPMTSNYSKSKIIEINKELSALSNNGEFLFLDLYKDFIDQKGQLREELSLDSIHINAQGYMLWGRILAGYAGCHLWPKLEISQY